MCFRLMYVVRYATHNSRYGGIECDSRLLSRAPLPTIELLLLTSLADEYEYDEYVMAP